MSATPSAGASPAAGERQKVKLASGAGGTFGIDDIAVAWATSGGFWEAEGLDIEWVPVRGGVKVVEAILDGKVDGGYGTWVPCVKASLSGMPVTVLASMAQALAQNLLARKDRITGTADIKGKRWGVDGIGALSHTLAQLIAQGLQLDAAKDVEWVVSGPPPQRIEQLLSGDIDCSLVRVEEAIVLSRQHPDTLCKLLGFEEIFPLAPTQPHGVISVSRTFAGERPDACAALVRGLIKASRSLHESLADFKRAVHDNVTHRPAAVGKSVDVSDEEVETIWRREVEAGSFAVNGGLSAPHWSRSLKIYASLYNDPRAADLTVKGFSSPEFVAAAVAELGPHGAGHDTPPPDVETISEGADGAGKP